MTKYPFKADSPRYLIFLASFVLVFNSLLGPAQAGEKPVEKICQVDNYIQSLLKSKSVLSQELLVIFDVDGTLTDTAHPDSQASGVKPRGNSVQMIEGLLAENVKVVISSAWHDFSATLHRLDEIGLGRNPLLKSNHENICQDSIAPRNADILVSLDHAGHHANPKVPVDYVKQGKIISVRSHESSEHVFYLQKALAPYLMWNTDELNKIRRVIFIEDSVKNVNQFDSDVKKYLLYPNSKIDYFVLGSAELDLPVSHHAPTSEKGYVCTPSDGASIHPFQPENEMESKFVLKGPPLRKKKSAALNPEGH